MEVEVEQVDKGELTWVSFATPSADEQLFFGAQPLVPLPERVSAETKRLEKELRKMVMQSKSGGTLKAYRTSWIRWVAWASLRSAQGERTPLLPARPEHVALFLVHRSERDGKSQNVAQHASTAINGVHRMHGLPEPAGHLSGAVLSAIRRQRGKPAVRAVAISVKLVKRLVRRWGAPDAPVFKVMIATVVLTGFAGFFRLGELLALRVEDVVFFERGMRIFVEVSKTDQFRVGAWVVIAAGASTCPVRLMRRYIALAGVQGREPLFRTIWRRKIQLEGVLGLGDSALGSKAFHRYFRDALVEVGVSQKEVHAYSGHSLRRGGSTAGAQARVPGHWRQHQGRWKSMESADLYVGAVAQDALQLTLSLGL